MAKVLYRKYRSKKLSEIVGQEHITKTLGQAIKSGRLSHAYLFTGPKGVGKTSVARILAHEVNDLPYNSDQSEIDIIEIDAASNRRIDEIRYLRDRVYIAPTSSKYKVYIIDEVHMLTKEAFNALLKTLEEPPEHVIFILATTDAAKLPDTIISRTQRYNFKPADEKSIISLLKDIAKKEKIVIEDMALELIAEHGNGSYRDSIGLLDQLSNSADKITVDLVRSSLGLPDDQIIERIIDQVEEPQSSYRPVLDYLNQLKDSAASSSVTASSLMEKVRARLVNNELKMPKEKAINLLRQLLKVDSSEDPEVALELILLDNVDLSESKSPQNVIEKKSPSKTITEPSIPKASVKLNDESWQDVLASLKSKHNTLYGIVRMAAPTITDNSVTLLFDFPFHQKQLKEAKNRQILTDAIKEVTGADYDIICELAEKGSKEKETVDLENINKIFGQAELLD